MLDRVIDFFLDRPLFVAAALIALTVAGARALDQIPLDAFPDLTNNQVVVVTEAPGMAAVEVEQLVTFPIESAMMGLPRTLETRSLSKLGLSMITIVFEDGVDPYLARQLVNERLNEARGRVPAGLEPVMGPIATPFGEAYQYVLESSELSAMELKTLHDWDIKYRLRAVRGVADVITWGGLTRRYEIVVEPARLRRYGLTLSDVYRRVAENNANFGAGFVERSSEQYTVRGLGRADSVDKLEGIVLTADRGVAVSIRDVGEVRIGSVPRQGAVTSGGETETLAGMVVVLQGQNSKTVIDRVKQVIDDIQDSLPASVRLVPFYDQSAVIEGTMRTVRNNLLEGGALVILVLFLSMGRLSLAFLVALVVPFSMLGAFLGMTWFGVTANLMSLGAVDFGVVIDGAIVMADNCERRLRGVSGAAERLAAVRLAAHEVSGPVLSGVLILITVYTPLFALQDLEGRMFRPMAVTVCSAVLCGLLLALFALPTGCRLMLRVREEKPDRIFGFLEARYRRLLGGVLNHRNYVVAIAAAIITVAIGSLAFIGGEFMPRLDEGSILVTSLRLPSVSLTESVDMQLEVERALEDFPEVTQVVSKLGRPDFATEAMGIYEADVYVNLTPREEWTTADTKMGLIEAMSNRLERVPGMVFNFTQPMAMRLDETVSGVRADVAVKIFGDDEDVLEQKAGEILHWLSQTPGSADVQREIFSGAAEWQVRIRRDALARYGLNVTDVRDAVESAIGGKAVTEVIDGRRRFGAVVLLPEDVRESPEALGELLLRGQGGELVRLDAVADIVEQRGPEAVRREDSRRRLVVQSNVRGRDLVSFVNEARERVRQNVELPPGYYLEWGGQFENQQRAMRRLSLLIPAVLAGMGAILYSTFGSARQSALAMLLAPFATVGGVAALWLRGMNLNVSASIGFLAVFGIAILDGIVLISTINRHVGDNLPLREALIDASATRLRPVIMTSVVAALGFLPMAIATSTGAEVQRPLATVVIGGLISSTSLTLLLVPALYPWFSGKRLNGRRLA